MTLNEYQELALRTAKQPITDEQFREMILINTLGLTGESGEFADLIKKVYGHSHEMDIDKLSKELGDVLWYVAILANCFQLDLSYVAERNIEKLRKRYPEGFTVEASKTRVE